MKKAVIAALALGLGASAVAHADQVIVLNSEEASYSILSRTSRTELQRLPVGREPHHLMPTPDGKEVLLGSTATNELLALDATLADIEVVSTGLEEAFLEITRREGAGNQNETKMEEVAL